MANLRSKIRWTIPGAGTAYTVLHFGMKHAEPATVADADEILNRVDIYCSALRPLLSPAISIQALNEIEVIDEATGSLDDVLSGAVKTTKIGSNASTNWAAPVGAVITWNTATVHNSRRIRGRSFVVPLASSQYDTDGTLTSSCTGALDSAATALRTGGTLTELIVWVRPTVAGGGADGTGGVVTSHRVPDMGAILRSRRS